MPNFRHSGDSRLSSAFNVPLMMKNESAFRSISILFWILKEALHVSSLTAILCLARTANLQKLYTYITWSVFASLHNVKMEHTTCRISSRHGCLFLRRIISNNYRDHVTYSLWGFEVQGLCLWESPPFLLGLYCGSRSGFSARLKSVAVGLIVDWEDTPYFDSLVNVSSPTLFLFLLSAL